MGAPRGPHRPEKSVKVTHEFLKDKGLEGAKLEPGEKAVYMERLRKWHARHKSFAPFFAKLSQAGFWKQLETRGLHEMLGFMLQDRHFQSKIDRFYINQMKGILNPESELMKQLKNKKANERRAFIAGKITEMVIAGKYLEAEILHMLYTMEAYNLKYLE